MGLFKPNIEKLEANRDVVGLCNALEHKDPEVRKAAAKALREVNDRRAVEPLLATMKQDEADDVRAQAIDALGDLRDARAFDPLIGALEGDQSPFVRGMAARVLGQFGDARALDPLVTTLETDEDYSVREDAAAGLRLLGDPRAVEPLLAALERNDFDVDESDYVRKEVIDALASLGDARAVEPLRSWLERHAIPSLRASDQHVREAIKDALEALEPTPGAERPAPPACPRCGVTVGETAGSPVSAFINVYRCPSCGWKALRCGDATCDGYLASEEVGDADSVRYTCLKCGWTARGARFP